MASTAAIVQAFVQAGRPCQVFIGHDLDADNVALLKSGAIHAVLRAQGALPALTQPASLSAIQLVAPWNLPVLNGLN